MKTPVIDKIMDLFEKRGREAYLGEEVTQLEHALQAAWVAEQNGESPSVVVASLLHDVGHLLHGLPDDCAEHGIDDRHEELGYRFLKLHFGDEIAEMVRLHVPAKRFLTATDPEYFEALSATSRRSLMLQGGAYGKPEADEFMQHPQWRQAVAVRRYDDLAKVPGMKTPDLAHFRPLMESLLRA